VAAAVIAIVISITVLATTWPAGWQRLWTSTTEVAHMLFSDYVLPFEVVSVLLTASSRAPCIWHAGTPGHEKGSVVSNAPTRLLPGAVGLLFRHRTFGFLARRNASAFADVDRS